MKLLFACAILVSASLLMPIQAVAPAARLLVLVIGLVATGIFPCMTLTVSAMRSESRSPEEVNNLYDQLRAVLKVLVTAFILAVISVLMLTALVASQEVDVDRIIVQVLLSITAALLTFLGGRVIAVGRAFFVILDLNRKQALLLARKKTQGERDNVVRDARANRFPEDDPTPRPMQRVG